MRAILHHPDAGILSAAAGLLAVALLAGMAQPAVFAVALAGAVAAGLLFLAFSFPTKATVLWLLITGMSLEMTLHDLIGDAAFQPTIAVVKGTGLVLAGVCALRFGIRTDMLNPAWAFLAIFLAGLTEGLHPGLTVMDSLRSAIGSVAPFMFAFCRLPRDWPSSVLRAVRWCPVVAVGASLPLGLAGVRPIFIDSGGLRLAGLGHPAFLASVCLPAVYACLIALCQSGRRGDLALLAVNATILLLTGARAPLAYAAAVSGISLATIRSAAFSARIRLSLLLGCAALLPVALLLAGDLSDIRVFNLFGGHEATNLSGRNLLWPAFEHAARSAPWFGWGLGAGNLVIPSTGPIARELHTWAAHNEYLRLSVEGGALGRLLLVGLFVGWVLVHTRTLGAAERRIMRLAFLAVAAHAVTDNLLISTPACVMFAFATAVFADGKARLTLPDSAPLA
ncbi:MAG TPA: O-antigen ligase family protein [Rhodopila sp.]|nr:O-antigen ligase family protein [Rhodopila sp.]